MMFRFRKALTALAIVMALCACAGAPAAERWESWWKLPEGVCSYDKDIDTLFYGILALTGVVFLGTELCLLVFIIKYRRKEGEKSFYTHGNHKLEMIWTITPAITLIIIALIQARTWNLIKSEDRLPDHNSSMHVQLFAQQFSWFFRYPDENGRYGDPLKTVATERKLVVPVGKAVILDMTSNDVIHSFFLPYMRLKQDVVPGMSIKCWFDASKTTQQMREDRPKMALRDPFGNLKTVEWDYPIACAELCGAQHYQMFGSVVVLAQPEYDAWLKEERAAFAAGVDKNGEERVEPEVFAKFWKVDPVTQQRIYGGSNKRTALKVPKVKKVSADEHGAAEPKKE
jgi:cytochrome c oxidase subunit 2